MKLYTEEQVIHAVKMARSGPNIFTNEFLYHKEEILEYLTPIELPSDEEIDIYVKSHNYEDMFENLLEYGAKWMRDKIINQNK